jgi:hypothetical protein
MRLSLGQWIYDSASADPGLASTDERLESVDSSATTPWYPALRLFRQDAPPDWSGTIRRMSEELRAGFPASR